MNAYVHSICPACGSREFISNQTYEHCNRCGYRVDFVIPFALNTEGGTCAAYDQETATGWEDSVES